MLQRPSGRAARYGWVRILPTSALLVMMVGVAREIFHHTASPMDPSPRSRASMEHLSPMKRPDQPDPKVARVVRPTSVVGSRARMAGWLLLGRSKPGTTT